jgi:transcriptional regulator with XRE-family HTH domain
MGGVVPTIKRKEIGSRLKECRLQAKLSQGNVADMLLVSDATISAWEKGTRTLDALKLADLALLYGVSSDFLLFGTHMVPEDLRVLFQRTNRNPNPAGE